MVHAGSVKGFFRRKEIYILFMNSLQISIFFSSKGVKRAEKSNIIDVYVNGTVGQVCCQQQSGASFIKMYLKLAMISAKVN